MSRVTRNKLLTRLAKIRGKCYSLVAFRPKLDTDADYTTDDDECTNTDAALVDDTETGSPLRTSKSKRFSKLTADDYTCTCCFEILLNPVSLLCGHNLCALCLANWFLISSKPICPTCRQEWSGSPKTNIVLK
jgi:hypothetical protein